MPAGRRPDILIVMADQMVPSALPFHGNPVTHAPAMSWLAESGVVFDATYTASPLCSPGRASFMTGLLPSRTRTYDKPSSPPRYPPSLTTCAAPGYRTVLSGKMHFCGPDQLHGFEERLTTDIYPADYGWTPDWDRPHQRPSWYHDMSSVIQAGPCVRSNQLDFDDEVAFAAERSLFGHIRSGDERPFCYVVSFSHPHDPFTISRKWWDLYRDDDIPVPLTLVWAVLDRASRGWRGFTMTAAGLRQLQDLRRSLLDPPARLRPRTVTTAQIADGPETVRATA